jgi:hypothetical protein
MVKLEIVVEVRVEAAVFATSQPVVHVGEMHVILMDNINVPAHQSHLQPKDSWVVSIEWENETNSITIRNPNKMNAEEHMPIFVDCPVTSKTFTKMGVEAYFIITTVPATKRYQLQNSWRVHCHEGKKAVLPDMQP